MDANVHPVGSAREGLRQLGSERVDAVYRHDAGISVYRLSERVGVALGGGPRSGRLRSVFTQNDARPNACDHREDRDRREVLPVAETGPTAR